MYNKYQKTSHSKHLGNTFENFIKIQCRDYLFNGVAEIAKEHDSRNYKEKLRVDFTGGTRRYNGKSFKDKDNNNLMIHIGIECKTTKADRFVLGNLRVNQLNYLKRLAISGGISLLLIEFRKYDKIIKIEILKDDVINNKNFILLTKTKKSINFIDISNFVGKDNVFNRVLPIDFLNVGNISITDYIKLKLIKLF